MSSQAQAQEIGRL
uniref:Uncharacterized protein n=1 Tax=Arundo donax TaxID=35708 RepID=A0A0A8Y5H6_ARUDO